MGRARDGEPEFWRIGQTKTKKNESKEDGEETAKKKEGKSKALFVPDVFSERKPKERSAKLRTRLNCSTKTIGAIRQRRRK